MNRATTHTALAGLVGLAVCAPAGPAASAAAPTTQSAADDLLQATPFKDPKSGITVRLPKGWVAKPGIEDTGFQSPADDQNQVGRLAANVVLAADPARGVRPADVDAIVAGKRAQYAKLLPGYRDEPSSGAVPTLPGKGVGRIDCAVVVTDGLVVHETQIWVVANDRVFTITCSSLADAYAANAATLDALIKTIAVP